MHGMDLLSELQIWQGGHNGSHNGSQWFAQVLLSFKDISLCCAL